jgi:ADP-ribose pyrophosphatase YjhB (NUDIX family)
MARTNIRVSAVIIRRSKILLIHRFRDKEEYWVFPGGGVEDGETIEEGLVREVKEETDLDVLSFKKIFDAYNESDGLMQPFFLCETNNKDPEIIGEEKDKNTITNSYSLVWLDFKKISSVWLVPDEGKKKLIEYIEHIK